MKTLSHVIALLLLLSPALTAAQTVYRCGNSYSQQPCPGASAIDTSDSRTPEQRAAHAANVKQEKRAADALEKSRLQEEAAARRAAAAEEQARRAEARSAQPQNGKTRKSSKDKDKLPLYATPKARGEKK